MGLTLCLLLSGARSTHAIMMLARPRPPEVILCAPDVTNPDHWLALLRSPLHFHYRPGELVHLESWDSGASFSVIDGDHVPADLSRISLPALEDVPAGIPAAIHCMYELDHQALREAWAPLPLARSALWTPLFALGCAVILARILRSSWGTDAWRRLPRVVISGFLLYMAWGVLEFVRNLPDMLMEMGSVHRIDVVLESLSYCATRPLPLAGLLVLFAIFLPPFTPAPRGRVAGKESMSGPPPNVRTWRTARRLAAAAFWGIFFGWGFMGSVAYLI